MGFSVPVLKTERLQLRGYRREDCESLLAVWQHSAVMGAPGLASMTREDV